MINKLLSVLIGLTLLLAMSCNQSSFDINDPSTYPLYDGDDLGVNYTPTKTSFKLWAPTAKVVKLRFYNKGEGGEPSQTIIMKKSRNGLWQFEVHKDIEGVYYTYQVQIEKDWLNEVPGPYAKAVGVNGKRAMVVDMQKTNPEGWENEKKPKLKSFSDIILYELHIRDVSIHQNSGIQHKGKFLGLSETGTTYNSKFSTGIDHIKEMGVTHVHILPAFDYRSIDESNLQEGKYNWGYDPQNFNVPEGSYATNVTDGRVRITEFKKMVQTMHEQGLRVVLDVVYNHVGYPKEQSFDQIVPGYYFRMNADGSFSNASGCGNETASDRYMMRKYMIESVKYWMSEYHLDGFRFDLMGIHDTETMNILAQEVHKIDSSIFLYGEGWTAGDSPLPMEKRTVKANMPIVKGIAAFSDEMRDGIKGHWNDLKTKGFVSGKKNTEETIKFGIVAATQHPQVDYKSVNYSDAPWSNGPMQTINYVSCHDNNTLWDKLLISNPKASNKKLKRMAKLANTIVLTSQGIPFMHAGVEFLRTKHEVENSFESPDSINWIDWSFKEKNMDVVEFYKGLIQMRKEHPIFRLPSSEKIATNLEFMDMEPGVVGYFIESDLEDEAWETAVVIFNANNKAINFYIDDAYWTTAFDLDNGYNPNGKKVKGEVKLDPLSAYVFYR